MVDDEQLAEKVEKKRKWSFSDIPGLFKLIYLGLVLFIITIKVENGMIIIIVLSLGLFMMSKGRKDLEV